MAQMTKYVDLTRSYIPLDPNSFPEGLHIADMKEENKVPVMALDGKNFLPTAYGYKSYFGTEISLGIDDLEERADWILLFQNAARNNFLIALCDSGIWYKYGGTTGAWTQAVVLPHNRADPLVHYKWSYTVQQNILYCYRENGANFYSIESIVLAPGISVNVKTPTFLNMAAQKGIFSAGNRLGFWDSDNATAWSALDDKENFTPDLETLAGITTFDQLLGTIVTCKAHGDGFIIYATKSILYIQRDYESTYVWNPTVVLKETGIAYPEQIVAAIPDTTHFAYTNTGLYKIESGSPEVLVPEITDFFRNMNQPKYLGLMEGRYLWVQIMAADYVTGFPIIREGEIPESTITFDAENINELWALSQGGSPTLTVEEVLELFQQGVFVPRPSEDGDGGPGGPTEG
jgi:hypothetical protein